MRALLSLSLGSCALLLSACGTTPTSQDGALPSSSGQSDARAARVEPPAAPRPESPGQGLITPAGQGDEEAAAAPVDPSSPSRHALLLGDMDEPHADVWARIRQQQQLLRHISRPAVRRQIAWLQKRPDYLVAVTARAAPYIHHIVEAIEARGMPVELALLPVVESAFKPTAYSRSHASGLWQFIPSTGRRYGLVQNEWYDGRRDVLASTRAALDYLQFLHTTFSGNWYHALAAYNAGEQAVLQAIARRKRWGKSFDFWSLRLPRETRAYVPKLLAVAEVVAWPEHYGLSLTPVPNQHYFEKVAADRRVSLRDAARVAGISFKALRALNPGFRKGHIGPRAPDHLLLPKEAARNFAQRLAAHTAAQDTAPIASGDWHQHRIEPGETLAIIASRYATSVAVLKDINQLRSDTIYSGKTLFVPAPDKSQAKSQAKTRSGLWRSHTVQRGDTLWGIGRSYGVSVRELQKWNNISSDAVLQPGQELAVPGAADA